MRFACQVERIQRTNENTVVSIDPEFSIEFATTQHLFGHICLLNCESLFN